MMQLPDFDYNLPEVQIAQRPLERRDASRLMVVHRQSGLIEHRRFSDLTKYLNAGDLLVLNNTRVIPARLFGKKRPTGARIELFLVREESPDHWSTLIRPGKRVQRGTLVDFGETLQAKVLAKHPDGSYRVRLTYKGDFRELLARLGEIPLPPYIRRAADDADRERYQNVYASQEGAIAAPTAGLHFTEALLDQLRANGIERAELTLHVGLGTFLPVKTDHIEQHQMHEEFFELPRATADAVNTCHARGDRVVAVGTTSVRTLEATAQKGRVAAQRGATDLFIYPGFAYQAVDALITNLHLPRSTLLMLVAAFGGYDLVMHAYQEAIQMQYRFYSYGDAMLLL